MAHPGQQSERLHTCERALELQRRSARAPVIALPMRATRTYRCPRTDLHRGFTDYLALPPGSSTARISSRQIEAIARSGSSEPRSATKPGGIDPRFSRSCCLSKGFYTTRPTPIRWQPRDVKPQKSGPGDRPQVDESLGARPSPALNTVSSQISVSTSWRRM